MCRQLLFPEHATVVKILYLLYNSMCKRVMQAKDLLDQARAGGAAPQARAGTENGAPAANGVRQRSGQAAESSSRPSEEKATPEQRELVLACLTAW